MNNLGNKKTLAKNLSYYMEERNVDRNKLSAICKVPYTTLTSWIKAERYPRIDKIQLLSEFFNIRMSDLVEEHTFNNEIKQIPLLGKIAAGYPTTMFADVIDYIDIPADMARGNKELFALKTKGKSMEPNFIEGDILIFEKTEDCENGQFCAVAVNGDDATFKKVTKTDTGIMLQPLNPDFETKFYTNEQIASLPVTIIGVLKQIRRNF